MIIKTRYNAGEPHKHVYKSDQPSLTQQQFKDECDINIILAKYRKTGMLTHINHHQGKFGDFSNVLEYMECLEKVMTAQNSFEMLPAELRKKFDNDPTKLIEFISDPKNEADVYKYGLAIKPTPTEPTIQQSMETALENNDKKRKASVQKKD